MRAAYGLNLMVCYYREYIKHFETFQAQKSKRLLHEVSLSKGKKRLSKGQGSRLDWPGISSNFVPGLESLGNGVWFMEGREC